MATTKKRLVAVLMAMLMVFLNGFNVSGFVYGETGEDGSGQTSVRQEAVQVDQEEDSSDIADEEQTDKVKQEAASDDIEKTEESKQDVTSEVKEEAKEETAEAAFSQTVTVDGVEVSVTADKGVFPEGATLSAEALKGDEEAAVEKAIEKVSGDEEVAEQHNLDISVLDKNGKELQPDKSKGEVNVAFETAGIAKDGVKAEVFHVGNNGKAESLDVATKGAVAAVEAESFSPYSIRLVYTNVDDPSKNSEFDIAVGEWVSVATILEQLGIEGTATNVQVDSQGIIMVSYGSVDGYKIKATKGDPGNTHGIEITLNDDRKINITVGTHTHSWTFEASDNEATLKCTADNCVWNGEEYKATITAEDATYDGKAHGASIVQNMPIDCGVSSVSYYNGTTKLSSTPVDAGEYKAEVTISPDGIEAKTISVTYTIAKANIEITPPEAIGGLVYNGHEQILHTVGSAKSATTDKTFTVQYKGESWQLAQIRGKDAGEYTVSYYVPGDKNHNDNAGDKITCTIGPKPVTVSGIKAKDRVYNSGTDIELDYSDAVVSAPVEGETLTVTAKGTLENKNAEVNKVVALSEFKLAAGNNTKVSNYVIDADNSEKSTSATIYPKMLLVDWSNATDLQYNGQPQAPTAVIKPGEAAADDDGMMYKGDEVTVDLTEDSWNTEIGGPYEAKVTNLSGKDKDNYYLDDAYSTTGAKYNIVKKILNVKWENIEQEYNDEELLPEATLETPVEGEDVSVKIEMDRESINAGTYVATATLEGEDKDHYEINLLTVASPFVIKKAPLEVRAEGWIYYGDRISGSDSINDLKYDIDPSQFKGDDDESVLGEIVRFETDYGSKYNLVDPVSDETHSYYLFPHFETADNYEIDNEDGVLTVYPKPVTLEWTHKHAGESEAVEGEQAFTYDGKNHEYEATVSEDSYVKVNGRQIDDDITVTLSGHIQRDSNVKTDTEKYTAVAIGLSNPNYALQEVVEGTGGEKKDIETKSVDYTIDQLPVELSWDPVEFTYNGKYQAPKYTIENLQENDEGVKDEAFEIDTTTEKLSAIFDEERETSIEAGQWQITAEADKDTGELADENYTLVDGKDIDSEYEIKPVELKLKWNPETKEFTYNGKTQEIAYEIDGLVEGDEGYVDAVTSEDSVFSARDAGEYTIKVTALKDTQEVDRKSNYTIKEEEHPWTIKKLPVAIKWTPTTTEYTYDGQDHSFEAEIVNIQSNEEGTPDEVELTKSGDWSANAAGSYTARIDGLEGKDGDNYEIAAGIKTSHAWKINKRDLPLATPTVTNFFSYPNENRQNMTWKKVSGATNYEMQYRGVGGNWITVKVDDTYFATAPKLKTKGMYEYRLRAVRAESATDKYRASAYTKVYYRYFAGVSGVKTASGTNRFSVSWNRDSYANGYMIYYSENENMSGAKAIQITSNTVTTKMVNNLPKGKKYYVQVRPYKEKNGNVYLGSPSVPPNVVKIF